MTMQKRTPEQIREIVRTAYNRVSTTYRPPRRTTDWFDHDEEGYRRWLQPVFAEVPRGGRVLDLGCGTGIPAARLLSLQFAVTGVDLSDVMVRRARRAVPDARFIRADLATVRFPPESFDAVIAFYSLFHLPRDQHRSILARIHEWLRPKRWFIGIVGHGAYEGVGRNWLKRGVTMYWSHASAATFRRWLVDCGFTVTHQEFVPEGSGGHELFWARRGPVPSTVR